MKSKILLHIPEPCHEDWNAMTPVQQGRYCQSCSKTVTDFSNLSDKQILAILSKAGENTCGRFSGNQLNRPVQPTTNAIINPYKLFFSAFIPAFLFANKLPAQKGEVMVGKIKNPSTITGDTLIIVAPSHHIRGTIHLPDGYAAAGASISIKGTKITVAADAYGMFSIPFPTEKKQITLVTGYVGFENKEMLVRATDRKEVNIILTHEERALTGLVAVYHTTEETHVEDAAMVKATKPINIKGLVTDEEGNGLPFATIEINGETIAETDLNGKFSISKKGIQQSISLTISYTGYSAENITIEPGDEKETTITLKRNAALDPVYVTTYPASIHTTYAGGLSVVRTVTPIDTVKTAITKLLNNELFRIYPNPASSREPVQLTFKRAGRYQIQLFDNNGRLYLQKDITIEKANHNYELSLPAAVSTGTYYVKATDAKSKKQFVDKLVIR